MDGIRQLLEMRRSELRKKAEPLETITADLRTKLAKADSELKVLWKHLADVEKALQAISKERLEAKISIKDAILRVLEDAPNGATSVEILAALNDRFFDGKLLRTSMSPQLSRLKKDDHKIRSRGDRYFLA
jgi:predicted  nucleic acid-binding Zn-ribbon protein